MKARWLVLLVVLGLAGCAWERQQLERERADLVRQREGLQKQLDDHPIGSRWGNHPDSMKVMDKYLATESRIREIDRQLGNW